MFQNKLLSYLKAFLDPKRFTKIVLIAALALYFAFGSYRLAQFVTADEHYWIYERIPQYWKALSEGKLKKTLINDKPGITLAYVAGPGLFFEKHPELYINKPEKHISVYDPAVTERLNLTFRWPVLIFNGLFSLFFFWIIRKFTDNSWIALWTSVLILLSPVLLGISRIVNPDSVLWVFSAGATFSLLAYLKSEEKKFAVLSSAFLGLSLLSKYSSVFLIPFFFSVILIYCFWQHPQWSQEELKKKTSRYLISYFFILLGAVALFVALLPAVLVSRDYFEEKTFSSLLVTLKPILLAIFFLGGALLADARFLQSQFLYLIFKKLSRLKAILPFILYSMLSALFIFILFNWLTGQSLINFDAVPFDVRKDPAFSVALPYWQKMILEFFPVVFSVSPLALLFLLFLWLRLAGKRQAADSWVFLSSFFLIAYYAAVISTGLLATIRYSAVVYPLLFLLTAFGIFEISKMIKNYRFANHLITLFLIFFLSLSLWLSKPFYFDYTSSLLPEKYLITGSWGEGGYEAAEYLNSLPDAKNLTVWADYNGVCEFFAGRCLEIYKLEPDTPKIDYYVLTRRGGIRLKPDHIRWLNPENVDAARYYKKNNPVWRLDINDRPGNFIKIFKSEDI